MKMILTVYLFVVVFLFQACSSDKKETSTEAAATDSTETGKTQPEIFRPTDYSIIMKYHEDFSIRASRTIKPFLFLPFYSAKAEIINYILDRDDCKYIVAVLGIDKSNAFTIDFVGSNKDGTEVLPDTNPDYANIKQKNDSLKTELEKTDIPLGLDNFPLSIKMEKDDFFTIRDSTQCSFYFAYPGIDPNDIHFTVSILGSDTEGFRVHSKHINDGLPGGETWPIENFMFLKKRGNGDIKFP